GPDSMADIVDDANDSEHWSRVNTFPERFVIEADVAASDRGSKGIAGFGESIDYFGELPHDVRLLGIAKVQAIGSRDRQRTCTRHLSGSFGNRVHSSQFGI